MRTLKCIYIRVAGFLRTIVRQISTKEDETIFSEKANTAVTTTLTEWRSSILDRGRFMEVYRATGLSKEGVSEHLVAEPIYEEGRLRFKLGIPSVLTASSKEWIAVKEACDKTGVLDIVSNAGSFQLVRGFVGDSEECGQYLQRLANVPSNVHQIRPFLY